MNYLRVKEVRTKLHRAVLYLVTLTDAWESWFVEECVTSRHSTDHKVILLNQENLCVADIRGEKDRPVDKNYRFTKNVEYILAYWAITRYLFMNVLEEKPEHNVTNKNWDIAIIKYKGAYFDCD
jgi:hypothetical protein